MREIIKRFVWAALPVAFALAMWVALRPTDDLEAREHQAAAPIAAEPAQTPEPVALELAEIRGRIDTNDDGARVRHEIALSVYSRGLDSVRAELDQIRAEVAKLRAEAGKFRAVAAAPSKSGEWVVHVTKASRGPEMRGGLK